MLQKNSMICETEVEMWGRRRRRRRRSEKSFVEELQELLDKKREIENKTQTKQHDFCEVSGKLGGWIIVEEARKEFNTRMGRFEGQGV